MTPPAQRSPGLLGIGAIPGRPEWAHAVYAACRNEKSPPGAVAVELSSHLAKALAQGVGNPAEGAFASGPFPFPFGMLTPNHFIHPRHHEAALRLQESKGLPLEEIQPEELHRELGFCAFNLWCVSPTDAMVEAVRSANELGIPLVAVDPGTGTGWPYPDRNRIIASSLKFLQRQYPRVLFVGTAASWPAIARLFDDPETPCRFVEQEAPTPAPAMVQLDPAEAFLRVDLYPELFDYHEEVRQQGYPADLWKEFCELLFKVRMQEARRLLRDKELALFPELQESLRKGAHKEHLPIPPLSTFLRLGSHIVSPDYGVRLFAAFTDAHAKFMRCGNGSRIPILQPVNAEPEGGDGTLYCLTRGRQLSNLFCARWNFPFAGTRALHRHIVNPDRPDKGHESLMGDMTRISPNQFLLQPEPLLPYSLIASWESGERLKLIEERALVSILAKKPDKVGLLHRTEGLAGMVLRDLDQISKRAGQPAALRAFLLGRIYHRANRFNLACHWYQTAQRFLEGGKTDEISDRIKNEVRKYLDLMKMGALESPLKVRTLLPRIPQWRHANAQFLKEILEDLDNGMEKIRSDPKDASHVALQLTEDGRFAEAETLLREILRIETDMYPEDHPKLPHRMNILSGVLLLGGKTAQARAINRAAWETKVRFGHDITSARILYMEALIRTVAHQPIHSCLYRIKLLLANHSMQTRGDVTSFWSFHVRLNHLRQRLSEMDFCLFSVLLEVLNDRGFLPLLACFPLWTENPAGIDLIHPH